MVESVMRQALNNWLQCQQNVSVMRQEVSVCDALPPRTREQMITISIDSAGKEREMGAPITHDYTLGGIRTGTRERVLIPRPEGTIGTYHTHPHGWPFPGIYDTLEVINHSDKITCIGATGKPGTKIQCFTPNEPKWGELQFKFRLLVSDIGDYNKKVGAKFKGIAAEKLLQVARTEPYWYEEGKELQRRRDALENEINAQLRELASPKEWKAGKWTNGFSEVPFFEAHPNIFTKCRVIWETLEEELPFEL